MSNLHSAGDFVSRYERFILKWANQICRELKIRDRQRVNDVRQGCFLTALRVVRSGTFDPSRGDFSHYLSRFCRDEAIENSGVVADATRFPHGVRLQITRIVAVIEEEPGSQASEIAERLRVPISLVRHVQSGLRAQVAISLNQPIRHLEGKELIDELEAPEVDLDERLHHEQLLDKVTRLVDHLLTARERDIIVAMFYREEPATLSELSAHIGVSPERVRQIKERALQKLQAAARSA